ncbi:MAG TPA: peptide-methionine (S)-S-oxide reductase, partial [Alphaproteobacteria bacterium]|nr:peptide-methionine (S)-S-oxide reductase [Alphaproteobacteria bacterium]
MAMIFCSSSSKAVELPNPALDSPSPAGSQTIVLAGGCFWGVQAVFQHVKGVSKA